MRNCLHLGFEFQLKLRHLRVDKLTKALVSKDDDDDENGASRSTLETTETVLPASSSKSNNEKNDKYPPVAVLVGDKFDNPEYFLWDKDKCQMLEWTPRRVRKYQPKFAKTDGTVSYISASQPSVPEGVTIREYKARNNGLGVGIHREMMNDVVLIESILKDLRSVERLKDA